MSAVLLYQIKKPSSAAHKHNSREGVWENQVQSKGPNTILASELDCFLFYPSLRLHRTQTNKTSPSVEALYFIHTIPFSRWIAEGWACLSGRWITPTFSQFNKVGNMKETALLIALAGSTGWGGELKNQEWSTELGIQLGTGNIWNRAPGWCAPGNLKQAICILSHLELLYKVSDLII